MPFKRFNGLLTAAFFVLLFTGGACGGKAKGLELRELTILRAAGGAVTLRAEIARSAGERQQGLMYRKDLAEGRGMLFVFDRDQIMSFWMKNTLIPLSIAYIKSDGSILEIRDMRPLDESPIRSSRGVRYALEVPQGWFDRAGIAAGDRLVLDGIVSSSTAGEIVV
ncbi:MAG: DUF192 domain-containing protein [Treponema sp.]|jgi:uncharacterized membrane protein (UPF0127 family)|nr:DUF192 domain-containing protein [Treponema sp.]